MEALAEAIIKIASNREFAKSLGLRALQTFRERFTLEKMEEKTCAIYCELIKAKGLLQNHNSDLQCDSYKTSEIDLG
jgi:hypothetical protein